MGGQKGSCAGKLPFAGKGAPAIGESLTVGEATETAKRSVALDCLLWLPSHGWVGLASGERGHVAPGVARANAFERKPALRFVVNVDNRVVTDDRGVGERVTDDLAGEQTR